MQPSPAKRISRLPSVKAKTGLSRSTIYQRITDGVFPRQVRLGARAIGWIESEVDAWIDGCVTDPPSSSVVSESLYETPRRRRAA